MHFSKWGANLPATMERPQFMHSKISLATAGWVCPKISTTYLLLVSPLLLESATLARACADNLNSSSSSSKFRSSPNLATRWHSDATSTIIESNKSSKKWDESWNHNSTKWIAAGQKKKHLHSRQQIITQSVIPENERTYYHRLVRTWERERERVQIKTLCVELNLSGITCANYFCKYYTTCSEWLLELKIKTRFSINLPTKKSINSLEY